MDGNNQAINIMEKERKSSMKKVVIIFSITLLVVIGIFTTALFLYQKNSSDTYNELKEKYDKLETDYQLAESSYEELSNKYNSLVDEYNGMINELEDLRGMFDEQYNNQVSDEYVSLMNDELALETREYYIKIDEVKVAESNYVILSGLLDGNVNQPIEVIASYDITTKYMENGFYGDYIVSGIVLSIKDHSNLVNELKSEDGYENFEYSYDVPTLAANTFNPY